MSQLTLLDVAKLTGSDAAIGLVEECLVTAPELRTLPIVPKRGTSYGISRRIGSPRGAFRDVNAGVPPGKSTYEKVVVPMYFFDGQMVVDESIVKADDSTVGEILAQEGAGQLAESFVQMADQIYRGIQADKKGFIGLLDQVDPRMVVDAGGTGNETETAWVVFEGKQGLHVPMSESGMRLGDWRRQQVEDDLGNKYVAYVNNLSFYVGLALGSRCCIGCVKNITASAPLTDSLGGWLGSQFPVGRQPTRWFMSSEACFSLQLSRSAVGKAAADSTGAGAFPPKPTELAGLPIVETNAIAKSAAW